MTPEMQKLLAELAAAEAAAKADPNASNLVAASQARSRVIAREMKERR